MGNMSNLTIGADPELAIISPLNRRYMGAQTVFNPTNPTRAEFGFDGNPNTVELRPKPSDNPLEVAANIFNILDNAKRQYPQVFRMDLKPSDNNLIVGGHIHFGHPQLKGGRGSLSVFTNPLDYLLAIPLSLVEVPEHRKARVLNGGYGKLGDYRDDVSWGFEYRTPASWLGTRELAESVLTLGYSIVNERLNNRQWSPESLKTVKWDDLREAHNKCMMSILRGLLPLFVKDIKTLEGYKTYKKHIDYLIDSSKAGRPLLATEIKEGWRIKFIRLADLKLSNLTDLVKRLAEAITLSQGENIDLTLLSPGKDFRVEDICGHVSEAIKNIVGGDILDAMNKTKLTVKGLKEDKGPTTKIDMLVPYDKLAGIQKLMESLFKEFGYGGGVKVNQAHENCIYIARDIRERDDYLAEAVTMVTWLYLNREAYKSKTETKNGKTVALPFTVNNAIKPLCITIKPHKRPDFPSVSDFYDDGGGISVERLAMFARNRLITRIQETREDDHRLRLPQPIRQAFMDALESLPETICTCGIDGYPSNIRPERLCDSHLLAYVNSNTFT